MSASRSPLVVAETLAQAQDAAEAIEIDYDTLPAVTDGRAALESGAPQLFDHVPGNLVFDWDNDTSDFAATDAAFAKAAHVTTHRDHQQSRGGELDGAAQRDRRLGCGGQPSGPAHRHAGLALRARSRWPKSF